MTEQPDAGQTGSDAAPDLEYDLAHETEMTAGFVAPSPADQPDVPPVRAATQTVGYGGDYGYDLAHDLPHE